MLSLVKQWMYLKIIEVFVLRRGIWLTTFRSGVGFPKIAVYNMLDVSYFLPIQEHRHDCERVL